MKYINEILTAVSVITLLGAVSCNKEKAVEGAGSAIRFGVSTSYENTPETKTTYTGENPDGTPITPVSTIERIDWESTDKIRILCNQATLVSGSDKYADYQIVPTDKTHAGLSPVDGNGLLWGEGVHDFIALYPSPAQLSGDHADATTLGENSVSGIIPATQTVTKKDHVFKPDMNYAYMYAIASGVAKGSDVQLNFKPLVTTLEFTLFTKEDDEITSKLTSVKLSSTQSDAYLAGTFTASLTTSGLTPVDKSNISSGSESNEITITLPDGGVLLSATEAYTVTFLTLPMSQTNLTLTLNFNGGIKRTLELKHDGNWITVPACKKTYIWNLAVPAQASEGVGEFTVDAEGKKVGFAPANLKYTGNGDGTGTWSIMDNPWDVVEKSDWAVDVNYGHSATSTEIISLFGWGTSGNGDGTRSDPWRTDSDNKSYGPNGAYDLTGDNFKYDWAYNTISGLSGSNWRTPSGDEWNYILKQRSSLVGHAYALATVAGTWGLVIFPDKFDFSSSPFSSYEAASMKSSNNIAASEWTALEAKGCVFLPAAGYRNEDWDGDYTWVYGKNLVGDYWSSTTSENAYARVLTFDNSQDDIVITSYGWGRCRGHSVRLVREVE